jgi:hypothetical protein
MNHAWRMNERGFSPNERSRAPRIWAPGIEPGQLQTRTICGAKTLSSGNFQVQHFEDTHHPVEHFAPLGLNEVQHFDPFPQHFAG